MYNNDQAEVLRHDELASYGISDSAQRAALDRLSRLAAGICASPVATISLLDAARQWCAASFGQDAAEHRHTDFLCAHVVKTQAAYVVPDTRAVPTACTGGRALEGNGIRAYAGIPLMTLDGVCIGAFAVMDYVPRVMTPFQLEALETLAQQVMAQLELARRNSMMEKRRRADRVSRALQLAGAASAARNGVGEPAFGASERRFRQLADALPYIVWSAQADGKLDYGNRAIIEYGGLSGIEHIDEEWIGLLHPDDVEPTLARWADSVRSGEIFSFEYRFKRADQTYRWHLAKGMPISDDSGTIVKWYGTSMDIHDMKLAHEEIGRLAFYDSLTKLPNRQLLTNRLGQALVQHAKSGSMGAVMLIDLDNFKAINDTLGHDKGDILLDQMARRLTASVRQKDTVARLGGDEFVIVLEDLDPMPAAATQEAGRIARAVLEAINGPFNLAGYERLVTPSIGVALFGGADCDIAELMKRADLAMYHAKEEGRNGIRFFEPTIETTALARAALESEMRLGLQENQFLLHYQPQVDAAGKVTGVEALARWQHPQRGMVSPVEFIPLAEETGLILTLGRRVLETACAELARLNARPETAALFMAVNVSALQFRQADFVTEVISVLRQSGARPDRLKIELTESLLLDGVDNAIDKIRQLKAHGVRFALDDFGTGYSSLSYLKRLPLDELKLDQSFVRNVLHDDRDAAIISTIISLAHIMGIAVIAEGVEQVEQRDFLAARGCLAYQGYLFSRPVAAQELDVLLRAM